MKAIARMVCLCLSAWWGLPSIEGDGLVGVTASAKARYRISVVDAGFGVSHPTAINNVGTIAGQADGDLQATLRERDGEVIKLGVQGDVFTMTNSGLLAVTVFVNADVQHCARWSRKQGLTVLTEGLGTPIQCLAWGINSRGEVVGAIHDSPTSNGAYFWDAEGRAVRLPDLAGTDRADAYDINEHGEVVGVALFGSGPSSARGFRWTEESGLSLLPLPDGATASSAAAINKRGDVAGSVSGPSEFSALALWRAYGEIVTLPFFNRSLEVRDMNERGWVVGTMCCVDNVDHAFLWIPGQEFIDLTEAVDLGVQSRAEAINNRGVVVGFGDGHDGLVWTVK
jgi:uncharacterized membrane protein